LGGKKGSVNQLIKWERCTDGRLEGERERGEIHSFPLLGEKGGGGKGTSRGPKTRVCRGGGKKTIFKRNNGRNTKEGESRANYFSSGKRRNLKLLKKKDPSLSPALMSRWDDRGKRARKKEKRPDIRRNSKRKGEA